MFNPKIYQKIHLSILKTTLITRETSSDPCSLSRSFPLLQRLAKDMIMPYLRPTVKPVLSGHSKRTPKIGFQYQLLLNAGSKGSILQYFGPSSSFYFTLRPLFCLFLSGHLRQFLLYKAISSSNSFIFLQLQWCQSRAHGTRMTMTMQA